MDIARAKTVAEVAQVIVNSAKAECEFIKLTGSKGSGFIPLPAPEEPAPGRSRLVKGRDTHD
jgi:hypothetical protein